MMDYNIGFKGVVLKFIPKLSLLPLLIWSGSSVVDNALDNQSRDDQSPHFSGLSDETLNGGPISV